MASFAPSTLNIPLVAKNMTVNALVTQPAHFLFGHKTPCVRPSVQILWQFQQHLRIRPQNSINAEWFWRSTLIHAPKYLPYFILVYISGVNYILLKLKAMFATFIKGNPKQIGTKLGANVLPGLFIEHFIYTEPQKTNSFSFQKWLNISSCTFPVP